MPDDRIPAGMKKRDLTSQLALESDLPEAAVADQVDRVVHGLMKRLRKGEKVSLPGLGKLRARVVPAPPGRLRTEGGGK